MDAKDLKEVKGRVKRWFENGEFGEFEVDLDDIECDTLTVGTWALIGTTLGVTGITTGLNFISTVATGTSPYACTSTTVNANLNADLWDGYQFVDYLNQAVKTTSSPTFVDLTLSSPSNIYALSHDSFADFTADEHFLQTAITHVSTALSTGLLKVTTGTGALSSITDSSSNWDDAYTHITSDGSDHTFIDQDVTIGSTPTFTGTNITAVASITAADESADTSCFPLFVTDATGTVAVKTGSNLTFNSNTGAFVATSLSDGTGILTGGALSGITTLAMSNQLTNTLAIGTAPFVITSTTKVSNLNVDRVDNAHVGTSGAAIPLLNAANTWSGNQLFGTVTELRFRAVGNRMYSNAADELTIEAVSLLTLGVAGDIMLGDSTERTMYPQTTVKMNLGNTSYRFNDVFANGDIVLGGLPGADPSVSGQLWNDGGTVKVSAG